MLTTLINTLCKFTMWQEMHFFLSWNRTKMFYASRERDKETTWPVKMLSYVSICSLRWNILNIQTTWTLKVLHVSGWRWINLVDFMCNSVCVCAGADHSLVHRLPVSDPRLLLGLPGREGRRLHGCVQPWKPNCTAQPTGLRHLRRRTVVGAGTYVTSCLCMVLLR